MASPSLSRRSLLIGALPAVALALRSSRAAAQGAPPPIPLVPTTAAAFLGIVPEVVPGHGRLPRPGMGRPVQVTSFQDFATRFGDPAGVSGASPSEKAFLRLAYGVRGFFENGGSKLWIVALPAGNPAGAMPDAARQIEKLREPALLACPGVADSAVQNALVTLASSMRAFAVLDSVESPGNDSLSSVLPSVARSSFAATYAPWLTVQGAKAPLSIPPSGHVVGAIAGSDVARGVAKAPTGFELKGTSAPSRTLSPASEGALAAQGVNPIVVKAGRGGPLLFGALTLSDDPAWKYISVRRTISLIERSIALGTGWVTSYPNGAARWMAIVQSCSDLLQGLFRSGALQGMQPTQAYFVRCDGSTTTINDLNNGLTIAVIGVALVKPAEFQVFRVRWQASGVVSTSD